MITKGQQAPYLYDVIENPPYRTVNDRLPFLFTIALPAMLKFQFALSANLLVPLVRTSICVVG
jgi:hypothetical protein